MPDRPPPKLYFVSTVTLPTPLWAVISTLLAAPAKSRLTLPPPLWAVMSDETVGLRWTCHSYAPRQAAQGKRNQGRPLPPPLTVRVAWPLSELRDRAEIPWFSKYCSVPLASSCS